MAGETVRVTFCGAAGTVTGSKYLVEAGNKTLLVDCGIFQGKKELRLRNWDAPPFDPKQIDAVVLTHAHTDHIGYLPHIVKHGFDGPIYCTPATKDIAELILLDAAHLQEEEASFANRHGTSKHKPAKPLFSAADAKQALKQIRTFSREQPLTLWKSCTIHAQCAGHILGSVSLSIEWHGRRVTFSGDIGRYDTPILPDPQPNELGDLFICESTYGNRDHASADIYGQLGRALNTALDRRAPVLIPSFAVGRTQLLLYYIAQLERDGVIPETPVFIDSPMAVNATNIYRSYRHDYDEDAQELLAANKTPLATERTYLCKSVGESKALNSLRDGRIIISASGMVTGGRILHHMRHWLPKEETTVLFVGFQAPGTRGATIQAKKPTVKIVGQEVPIRAQIETISGLSAHGDRNELARWIKSCSGAPKQVKIVHGEPDAAEAFSAKLQQEFKFDASPAQFLETVEVS